MLARRLLLFCLATWWCASSLPVKEKAGAIHKGDSRSPIDSAVAHETIREDPVDETSAPRRAAQIDSAGGAEGGSENDHSDLAWVTDYAHYIVGFAFLASAAGLFEVSKEYLSQKIMWTDQRELTSVPTQPVTCPMPQEKATGAQAHPSCGPPMAHTGQCVQPHSIKAGRSNASAAPTKGNSKGISKELQMDEDSCIRMAKDALMKALSADARYTWEPTCDAMVKKTAQKGPANFQIHVTKYKKMLMVRTQCLINASKAHVLHLLERGLGGPKGTETAMIKHKSLGTDIKLMWMGIKLPLVKNREFVVLQWVDQPSGPVSALVRTSLPPAFAAHVRPVTRSRVRGHMETQCTVIAEVPGNPAQCFVKAISCVDPGGGLPNLKGLTGTKAGDAMLALHKFVAH